MIPRGPSDPFSGIPRVPIIPFVAITDTSQCCPEQIASGLFLDSLSTGNQSLFEISRDSIGVRETRGIPRDSKQGLLGVPWNIRDPRDSTTGSIRIPKRIRRDLFVIPETLRIS